MKKLMLTAAVAAIASGAFALCGEVEPIPAIIVKAAARTVYTFNFCGKTTKGAEGAAIVSQCGETSEGCIARIPAKLKIKGWLALCGNGCTEINAGTEGAAAYAFWVLKPYKGWISADDVALDFAGGEFPHVIGKKPNKAEAFGTLAGTVVFADQAQWSLGDGLYFAGLGKYKAPLYKKIKGNFAGSPAASWYVSNKVCKQSSPYDCETLTLKCDETPNTVAFGKWTMKYSKSASKKFPSKTPKTPSWATAAIVVKSE